MHKNDLQNTLIEVKKNSPKRKFKQSYDLIINFKNLDLKKTENQLDVFAQMHHDRGKKVKICALVGGELKEAAASALNKVIVLGEFDKYQKDKKLCKKLAKEHDFFVAQANIMPKVAGAFGKVLGPRGKMPNPKAGCVVPLNANLGALSSKLQNTIRLSVKTKPLLQCRIGNEDSKDEHIIDNAFTIYNSLIHALPNEKHNIKSVYLKLTMGPSVKVGRAKEEATDDNVKKQKKPKEVVKEETKEEAKPKKD